MRTLFITLIFMCSLSLQAQVPVVDIIREAIKKVIIAADLQVQRFQNNVIKLQEAQQELENKVSKLKLDEIQEWTEKQRKLYADYFNELRQVKQILQQAAEVTRLFSQVQLFTRECKDAWRYFQLQPLLTREERQQLQTVYAGMLKQVSQHLQQLSVLLTPHALSMTDASRSSFLSAIAAAVQQVLLDLKQFNAGTKQLLLARKTEATELEYSRRMRGE